MVKLVVLVIHTVVLPHHELEKVRVVLLMKRPACTGHGQLWFTRTCIDSSLLFGLSKLWQKSEGRTKKSEDRTRIDQTMLPDTVAVFPLLIFMGLVARSVFTLLRPREPVRLLMLNFGSFMALVVPQSI